MGSTSCGEQQEDKQHDKPEPSKNKNEILELDDEENNDDQSDQKEDNDEETNDCQSDAELENYASRTKRREQRLKIQKH